MLKNILRRACAAFLTATLLASNAAALDASKIETKFDGVLYQIERYGLFAEDNPLSDQQRASYNARIDGGEDFTEVVNEILEQHDTHSFYLSQEDYSNSFSTLTTDYVGIGITVTMQDGSVVIREVNFGGPAKEAGILAGDVLTAVDGTPLAGKTLEEAGELLRGEPGSSAALTIIRAGREMSFSVRRRAIYGDYVWSQTLSDGIEYIRIEAFGTMDDAAHFVEIWDGLDEKNTAAVILDLRGNGGGLVDAGLEVLNKILTKPVTMVTCRWRRDQGGSQVSSSDGGGLPLNGLYVLVDGGTASAAEMVAACLKDNGAGVLIGEKTYGKSQGQYHLKLASGDSLVITTMEMSAPKSGVWEGKGITPNVEAKPVAEVSEYLAGMPALQTSRPLLFGEQGEPVRALTERLRLLGLLDTAGDTLNAEVLGAVRAFQQKMGLPQTLCADTGMLETLDGALSTVSDSYVDNALEQALERARKDAAKPLRYTAQADGSWRAA